MSSINNNVPENYLNDDLGWDSGDLEFYYDVESPKIKNENLDSSEEKVDLTKSEIAASKIKLNQLYSQVKKSGRPDEKDLLGILDEALKDIRSVKDHGKPTVSEYEEAIQLYDQVQQSVEGNADSSSDAFGNLDGSSEGDAATLVLNKEHQEDDTAVDSVDQKKGIATYKSNQEVVLHNYFNEDGVKTVDIHNVSQVTLYPANPSDKFVITFDQSSNQFKIETSGGKGKKTYLVDSNSLSKAILASSNVDTSALSAEQRDKIQVGLDEAVDAKAKKLDIMKTVKWPVDGIKSSVNTTNTNSSHAGGGGSRAEEICDLMDKAVQANSWVGVAKYIRDNSTHDWNAGWTQYNDEYMNDAIRKIVTGIYRASGAKSDHDPKFMAMLKLIPEDVRQAMKDGVLANNGELQESHGDQWNSQTTADLIDASLKYETGDPEENNVSSTN